MDSDSALVAEQPPAASTEGDTIEALKLQITALRNELIEKDKQHQLETRKLKRDIYALDRANEDLQLQNQNITIEFNCRRHEFISQQIDLQQREIEQHLELIELGKALGNDDAPNISEMVRKVNAMAARRVAITPVTPSSSKKRKHTSDWTSEADNNENGRGETSSSPGSLGGWSAVLRPQAGASSSVSTPLGTNRGPVLTPGTSTTPPKRNKGGRVSKKKNKNNVLDRHLGDFPEDYVMESGTVVWGKVPSNPWYPGVVLFDEDIREENLLVPFAVSTKFEKKKVKIPYVPHFIIRFFDNNWACLPLSSLKMLGEIPELDQDMVALQSQFQGRWGGNRHAEITRAFKEATKAIGSGSD